MSDIKIALISLQSLGDRVVPFGLTSLATYLEQKNGIVNVKIIDKNFENITKEVVKWKPDIIGISAMTILYDDAILCASELKKIIDIPIIIGGVHISTMPESLERCFDIGVIGEGEETLLELVNLYQLKKKFEISDLKKVKGIVLWNDDALEHTDKRPLINNLDDIPMPDYKYVDQIYFNERPIIGLGAFKRTSWLMTSRGCPYKCIFCSTSKFWDKIRFYPAVSVARHIKYLLERYGINHIIAMDDLFTVNKGRIKEFICAFMDNKILGKFSLAVLGRADTIDDEMCGLLNQLNVKIVNFGFESGSGKILSWLKGYNIIPETNFKAIKTCKKHGLKVFGSFMFGIPGETIEDLNKTVRFIQKIKDIGVDYIFPFIATPYPATQFWSIAKDKRKVMDQMDFKKLSLYANNEPLLLDDQIKYEDFIKLYTKARRLLRSLKYKMLYDIGKKNFLKVLLIGLKNPFFGVKKIYRFVYKH